MCQNLCLFFYFAINGSAQISNNDITIEHWKLYKIINFHECRHCQQSCSVDSYILNLYIFAASLDVQIREVNRTKIGNKSRVPIPVRSVIITYEQIPLRKERIHLFRPGNKSSNHRAFLNQKFEKLSIFTASSV